MPLLHISMRSGKPPAYRQAVIDSVYRAMRETFDVPDDDQFMTTARLLGQSPGIRPEDVFVNLVEVARENWSLGNGLAQYA